MESGELTFDLDITSQDVTSQDMVSLLSFYPVQHTLSPGMFPGISHTGAGNPTQSHTCRSITSNYAKDYMLLGYCKKNNNTVMGFYNK